MANCLTASDVGQFGPSDCNLPRFKQAGQYAQEAKYYAEKSEAIYNELANNYNLNQLVQQAKDAAMAAKVSELAAADSAALAKADADKVDAWVKDLSTTDFIYISPVGGEISIQLPSTFNNVRTLYVNGSRQTLGDTFSFDPINHTVNFLSGNTLQAGDKVIVVASTIYEQISTVAQTLQGPGGADYVKTGDGTSVQQRLDKLDQSIPYITPEMFGAIGDGVVDDTLAINKCFSDPDNVGGAVSLSHKKTYKITGPLDTFTATSIKGNGASIVYAGTPTSSTTIIKMGMQKVSFTSLNIQINAFDTSITIPGISGSVEAGDLLSLRSSTTRISAPESNYMFGQRCVVKSVENDVITLMNPIYESFVITSCTVHKGGGLSITDLTLDLTSVPNNTFLIEGISLTGVGISMSGCKVKGSRFCSAGVVVQGCDASLTDNLISGFLNSNGVSTGGRTGYGFYIDCNNTVAIGNHLEGNKHQLTCAARSYVMSGLLVSGNTASSIGQTTSEAVFDLHANVLGLPVFENNDIRAQRAAFGIRNGSVKISGNYIYSNRPTDTTPALVGLDEYPSIRDIIFSGNSLECSSTIRLFSFGEVDSINNLVVSENTGSIGSIIDQAMNLISIKNLSITNNTLSGMVKVINMNRRSKTSPQRLFSNVDELVVSGNYFDCSNGTLADTTFNIYTHTNTDVVNKLVIQDLIFSDNIVKSKDTPVVLDYIKLTGVTRFSGNRFDHAVSANTVTPPTQNSILLLNTSTESIIVSENKFPGRFRFTVTNTQTITNTAYPTEDVSINFDIHDNVLLGSTFEQLVNSADFKITFSGLSKYKGNRSEGLFGTTLAFLTSFTTMGWGSSGIVDINDNILKPSSGNSISIGPGWGTHKFILRNNIITAAISDQSTASVAPSGNITVS